MIGRSMNRRFAITLLANLFFLWVLLYFGLGGVANAWRMLTHFGPLPWLILAGVVGLLLYRSDYRTDLPLFAAGLLLGYWGEWWGTTRGVWTYWNGATPPSYLPPLWGIGLLTVYRLSTLLAPPRAQALSAWVRRLMWAGLLLAPPALLARSLPLFLQVDWRGRLDFHFFAGLLVALALIIVRFDLRQVFAVYLCGTLLGGLYEFLGTTWGEWAYITGETPPLWIAPLWGLASVAMLRLAQLLGQAIGAAWRFSLRLLR